MNATKSSGSIPSCLNVVVSLVALTAAALIPTFAYPVAPKSTASPDGAQLYQQYCANCHSTTRHIRAPQFPALRRMRPEDVLDALEIGAMKFVGFQHTESERRAIAEFVTGKHFGPEAAETLGGRCTNPGSFDPASGPQWNGWGNSLENARFQTATGSGLSVDEVAKLKVKWAFGFPPDTQLSQPTVVGGRVFVGSLRARIYSLDAASGCLYWSVKTSAGVRTAMTVGALSGSNPPRYALYFGDLAANVHALNAETGEQFWSAVADTHPMARISGAPVLYKNRLYAPVSSAEEVSGADPKYSCCTFRGSVIALDAATGKKIWQAYTIPQSSQPTRKNNHGVQLWGPAGAGVWSAPTIDTQLGALYVTTGDNYADPATKTSDAIVAFDLKNGTMLWSRQFTEGDAFNIACATGDLDDCPKESGPDLDFGSSAILRTLPSGKRVLVAGQKSGIVHAVDPDRKGAVLWHRRVGRGGMLGGIQWGPAADNDNAYVALSDIGIRVRRDPSGDTTTTLDPRQGGGLFAIDLASGELRWATPPGKCGKRANCSPAQSAAVTGVPGVVFSGSEDGHMRAYSVQEGKVVWDFDTERKFKTVNAMSASGGSLDGPGPTVAGGMLCMGAGYGFWGGMPGNVLLGLSVDGK